MKTVIALCTGLLLASALGLPSQASANELESTMKNMNRQYRQVLQTDDPARMGEGLAAMHRYASEARTLVPDQLADQPADNPERQAYVQGIDELLEGIERAQALLQNGQLEQARAAAEDLKPIRKQYHRRFKVK